MVGNLLTSVLGAAADAASAGGVTEPGTSFIVAGTAAPGTGAPAGARSLSTASLSLPGLAAGAAYALSNLSRRSLVLLNWLMPSLEACSRPVLSAWISAS